MCCKRTRLSRCDMLVLRLAYYALAEMAAQRAWRVESDRPAEQGRELVLDVLRAAVRAKSVGVYAHDVASIRLIDDRIGCLGDDGWCC